MAGEVPTMQECMDNHAEWITSREEMITQLEEMLATKTDEIINKSDDAWGQGFLQMWNDYYIELWFNNPEDLAHELLLASAWLHNTSNLSRQGIVEIIHRDKWLTLPEQESDYVEGSIPYEMANDLEWFVFSYGDQFDSYNALQNSLRTVRSDESSIHEDLSQCLIDVQNGTSK